MYKLKNAMVTSALFIALSVSANAEVIKTPGKSPTQAMLAKVNELLAKKDDEGKALVSPADIVVISDVDGVLLAGTTPKDDEEGVAKAGALETVKGILDKGVTFIASSAWNNPSSTTRRLRDAGFGEMLQLGTEDAPTVAPHEAVLAGQPSTVANMGLIGSVKRNNHKDKIYYRGKALSPELVLGDGGSKKFKYVIFGDDSPGNLQYFEQDLVYGSYNEGTDFYLMVIDPQGVETPDK